MKQLVLSLFGLLFTLQTQAQYKISGTVSDMAGKPLVGAAVTVKEQPSLGAVADTEGRYEMSLPGKGPHTLCASFVGYEPVSGKVAADQPGPLNFRLAERSTMMDQVVVTATRTPKLLKESSPRPISNRSMRRMSATCCRANCRASSSPIR